MPFTPYAQSPGRRTLQLLGDLLLLAWIYLWIRVGQAVHDATLALAEPGRRLEAGAIDIASSLADAGATAADIPLVGDDLQGPFASAGDAATAIADAGRRQVEVVQDLALLLGLVVVAIPVLIAVLAWLPGRVRFARRAGAARRFVDTDADLELFALRAMANQPMHRLATVSDDPVTAWRSGDRAVVRALATLELRDVGLRPPAA